MDVKKIMSGILSSIGSGLKTIGSFVKKGTGWLWDFLKRTKLVGVYMDDAGVVHANFSLDGEKISINSKLAFSLTFGSRSIIYNPETSQITVQL